MGVGPGAMRDDGGGGEGDNGKEDHKNAPSSVFNFSKVVLEKAACATPTLTDCANCGASEGSILGTPAHNACSRCEITYYCSVMCQKRHWKEGGHKKRCMTKEERSVAKALAAAKEGENDGASGGGGGGGGGAKAKKKARDKGNECAVCLEDLDDPEFGPAQILDCTHRFHRACVEELQKGSVKKCPTCRAKLPPSAEKK